MRGFLLLLSLLVLSACAVYEQRQAPGASTAQVLRTVVVRAEVPLGTQAPIYLSGNIAALGPWNAAGLAMTGTGRERVASLKIPEGTAFEFKITLGTWEREALGPSGMVMANHRQLVEGDQNIKVVVTDFKKEVKVYIQDGQGSGVKGTLLYWLDVSSKYLAHPRHVSVWLPPGYQAQTSKRYRVVYMSDGQNLFDPRIANTGQDWGVDEAMTRLTDAGEIEPAIVVAAWSSPSRGVEYSPWHDAEKYARFLIDELMPRVNSEFRTLRGPENTFHMGSSMGGLLSFYLTTHHPKVFGGCGCISTHFPLSEAMAAKYFSGATQSKSPDQTPYIEHDIANGVLLPKGVRMWLDHGTQGLDASYAPSHESVRQWLLRQGFIENQDFVMRAFEGADHNEASWRARLDLPLRFLLGRR